jgi:hypothetical protein
LESAHRIPLGNDPGSNLAGYKFRNSTSGRRKPQKVQVNCYLKKKKTVKPHFIKYYSRRTDPVRYPPTTFAFDGEMIRGLPLIPIIRLSPTKFKRSGDVVAS